MNWGHKVSVVPQHHNEEALGEGWSGVCRFARRYAPGDAEDVTQEAYARALASGVELDSDAWLRTVGKRIAIDNHRRRREVSGEVHFLNFPDHASTPEDRVVESEEHRLVREAMTKLPSRYRYALTTFAARGRASDVAERMGISDELAHTVLSRARRRLRVALEASGFVAAIIAWQVRFKESAPQVAAAAAMAMLVVVPSSVEPVEHPSRLQSETASAPFTIEEDAPQIAGANSASDVETHSISRVEKPAVPDPASDVTFATSVGVCSGDEEYGVSVFFENGPRGRMIKDIVESVPIAGEPSTC